MLCRTGAASAVVLLASTAFCWAQFQTWNEQRQNLTPQGVDIPIPTVRQDDPVTAPPPVQYYIGGSVSGRSSTTVVPLRLNPNLYDIQQLQPPSPPTQASAPTQTAPTFVGAQVTGFGANQTGIIFVPSQQSTSRLEPVSVTALKFYESNPQHIILNGLKTAGSLAAPNSASLLMLKGGSDTADLLRAYQSGGLYAEYDKAIEKVYVNAAAHAGSAFGPGGRIAAGVTAQVSWDTGRWLQPWIDSKLKISDGMLAVDRYFGISGNARALNQSEKAIADLQSRLDSQRSARNFYPTAISSAPTAPLAPATTRTPITPFPSAAGRPMTVIEAYSAGVNLQNLRPLTPYEKLSAIADGVDPKRVDNLRVADPGRTARTVMPNASVANVPVNRPYLGAGQQAIDKAFTPDQTGNKLGTPSSSSSKVEGGTKRQNFASLGIGRREAKQIQSVRTATLAPPQQTSVWDAPGKPSKYVNADGDNRKARRRHRPAYRHYTQSHPAEYDNSAEVAQFALMFMLGVAQGAASSYINRPRAPRYAPAYRSPGRTCFITAGPAVFGVRAC